MNASKYAKLAILMGVLYELLLALLIFLRPDLPVYSTTISEWAIGKYGWLMQTAFILSALGYLFLAMSLKDQLTGFWPRAGLILLLICFLGTTGVGIFVTNPYPPDMTITRTLIHTICGTSAMILLPLAAVLISFRLAKSDRWIKHKTAIRLSGLLPLLAFIGFVIHLNLYIIPLGRNAIGPNVPIGYPPRILFFCYHVWLVIIAILNIKTNQI